MLPSLRALLSGIIDYAGLFPPARLSLDQAIRRYTHDRQGSDSWLLGRFVCPAVRLAELSPYRENFFNQGPPFAFSVLLRPSESTAAFLDNLRLDLDAVAACCRHHGDRVRIDQAEIRLARPITADGVCELFDRAGRLLGAKGPPVLQLYAEAPEGSEGRSQLAALAAGLARYNGRTTPARLRGSLAGLKLRCGGLEPATVPAPEYVSAAITVCRDAGVPLKYTAGLHQPIRHRDAGFGATLHGFLNLFVAGVLARVRRLGEADVCRIVADEDPADFRFDADGMRWRDLRASVADIHEARREAVTSFGSCSFDEPREGLHALGLLGQETR